MYKIIDLEQDTDKWLKWRMSGITATDASIIMGHNKFESIENLFLVKAGLKAAEFKTNPAIEQGKMLEPEIRKRVNLHYQEDFKPACVQNLQYDFVLSSLDGISKDGKICLEIKAPTVYVTHRRNIDNMPDYYRTQVEYQLLCTQAEYAVFASYLNGDLRLKLIYPDKAFQKEMLKKVKEFWEEIKAARNR